MFEELYYFLFNRVTDAVVLFEAGRGEQAARVLIRAQQDCEERYLSHEEDKADRNAY